MHLSFVSQSVCPHYSLKFLKGLLKVLRGLGGGVVACRVIVSAPVSVPFLWTLDFGFWTWILDLDFGPGFWTWISNLDLGLDLGLTKISF